MKKAAITSITVINLFFILTLPTNSQSCLNYLIDANSNEVCLDETIPSNPTSPEDQPLSKGLNFIRLQYIVKNFYQALNRIDYQIIGEVKNNSGYPIEGNVIRVRVVKKLLDGRIFTVGMTDLVLYYAGDRWLPGETATFESSDTFQSTGNTIEYQGQFYLFTR